MSKVLPSGGERELVGTEETTWKEGEEGSTLVDLVEEEEDGGIKFSYNTPPYH